MSSLVQTKGQEMSLRDLDGQSLGGFSGSHCSTGHCVLTVPDAVMRLPLPAPAHRLHSQTMTCLLMTRLQKQLLCLR